MVCWIMVALFSAAREVFTKECRSSFYNFYISGRCGVLKSCKNSQCALKNTARTAEKSATNNCCTDNYFQFNLKDIVSKSRIFFMINSIISWSIALKVINSSAMLKDIILLIIAKNMWFCVYYMYNLIFRKILDVSILLVIWSNAHLHHEPMRRQYLVMWPCD